MIRRFILVAATALVGVLPLAGAAQAQYYPPGGDPYYRGGGYERDYERRSYRERRGWDDDDDGYYERRRPQPRQRAGSVCVTARGNCDAGFRAPRNTPCRCFIPGFGEKRGAIGY